MAHGITDKDSMFSVREMPWHGLGAVLDDYPESVDEALEKSGLTWSVGAGDVFVARPPNPESGLYIPQLESNLEAAKGWRANIREDTGDVLGIVSADYTAVQNHDAFKWLDELLYGDVQIETAGSLHSGKRVWVLAVIPELVEVGGDPTRGYVYAANSHDGSMAVTAARTRVRIVCANTLGWAMRESESNEPQRVYKFRHTGDMQTKMGEARRVMDVTLRWDEAFKRMGDELARQPLTTDRFDQKVVRPFLGMDDPELGKIAVRNREENRDKLVSIFSGTHPAGDTRGNSPGTKWTAVNAIGEYCDWNRRYTKNSDQMQRSFEDQTPKQRGYDLVLSA